MFTNINETRTLIKHISCNCKCQFDSTTSNSNQKWNNERCQCECKNCLTCKDDYNWNPSTCICENCKYLKSIIDESVIVWDEIKNAADSARNVTNNISTNVTSTVPRTSDDEKVKYRMNCYILHKVVLVVITMN